MFVLVIVSNFFVFCFLLTQNWQRHVIGNFVSSHSMLNQQIFKLFNSLIKSLLLFENNLYIYFTEIKHCSRVLIIKKDKNNENRIAIFIVLHFFEKHPSKYSHNSINEI